MYKVIIGDCENYEVEKIKEKINEGIEELGGWDKYIKWGMTVILKVNLVSPRDSESAVVTHRELVRAIVQILKEKSCTVWIGDSAGGIMSGDSPTGKAFAVSGIGQVAREEGAELKNFDTEGVIEKKDSQGRPMYLAKPLYEADVVINLPKLKTHSAAIYTGAMKNMFGAVPGIRKSQYHKEAPDMESFGRVIADINDNIPIKLHIMDAITSMDGAGPTAGRAYLSHKILIGENQYALDTIALAMIGLDIKNLPVFKEAVKRNESACSVENIEIGGNYSEVPLLEGFKIPNKFYAQNKSIAKNLFPLALDLIKTQPRVDIKKCKNCNVCVDSCPVNAIDRGSKRIDGSKCISCLCCHEMCPHQAIKIIRKNPIARIFMK